MTPAHPGTTLIWFGGLALVAMTAFFLPVGIALFASLFLQECLLRGPRALVVSLAWQVPLLLVIVAFNGFSLSTGGDVLWQWGWVSLRAPGLLRGISLGLVAVNTLIVFQNFAAVADGDQVLELLGPVLPNLGLVISLAMNLIPAIRAKAREVEDAGRACTASGATGVGPALLTLVFAWSLEDSLVTADAMRARGWGAGRRSSYASRQWTVRDSVMTAVIVPVLVVTVAFLILVEAGVISWMLPAIAMLVYTWAFLPWIMESVHG